MGEKKRKNFRLSDEARKHLADLSGFYGLNETATLELILRETARREEARTKRRENHQKAGEE